MVSLFNTTKKPVEIELKEKSYNPFTDPSNIGAQALFVVSEFNPLYQLLGTHRFFRQENQWLILQEIMKAIQKKLFITDMKLLEEILVSLKPSFCTWKAFAFKLEQTQSKLALMSVDDFQAALLSSVQKQDFFTLLAVLLVAVDRKDADVNKTEQLEEKFNFFTGCFSWVNKTALQVAVESHQLVSIWLFSVFPGTKLEYGVYSRGQSVGSVSDLIFERVIKITPLMMAAKCDSDCAALLIKCGADVNAEDAKGRSVVWHAQNNEKSLLLLLTSGSLTEANHLAAEKYLENISVQANSHLRR